MSQESEMVNREDNYLHKSIGKFKLISFSRDVSMLVLGLMICELDLLLGPATTV